MKAWLPDGSASMFGVDRSVTVERTVTQMHADIEALHRKRAATHDDPQAPKLTATESVALDALDEGHGECAYQAIQDERDLKADNARLRELLKHAEWKGEGGHWDEAICPWCYESSGRPHSECPAFTADGIVK